MILIICYDYFCSQLNGEFENRTKGPTTNRRGCINGRVIETPGKNPGTFQDDWGRPETGSAAAPTPAATTKSLLQEG